MVHAFIFVNIN